jgi:hypothetical protein
VVSVESKRLAPMMNRATAAKTITSSRTTGKGGPGVVAALEEHDLEPFRREPVRGRQPGKAAADAVDPL